jgi:hypothetical protein
MQSGQTKHAHPLVEDSPSILSDQSLVAACPVALVASATSTSSELRGFTNDVRNVSCLPGFSYGGGVDSAVSGLHTCVGTSPGISNWSPSPATTNCECKLSSLSTPCMLRT